MIINPVDRDFIESHKVYFDQARMKFLHGFAPGTMDRFYEIYKRYINPGYVLTPWCSECVIDMVTRLGVWYNDIRDQELLSVQAGADTVANSASLWPEEIDTVPVIIDEGKKEFSFKGEDAAKVLQLETTALLFMMSPEDANKTIKSAGHSLDAPEKRGKGRPKKKK
jgi:hypothetical protein